MSPRERFDRFMADVRNGTNFKLAPLSHAHYRAFFSAVLPIAAVSDIRGAFMVNGQPATVDHMRLMAPTLSANECRSALDVFREAGLLEHDEDLGAEWVHDFEEWNPEPKRDDGNAERQRRYRERQKASRNASRNGARNVTRNVTVTASNAGEVEVEVVTPPLPPQGESEQGRVVTFRRRRVPAAHLATAERALVAFNEHAGQNVGAYRSDGRPSESLTRILGAITDRPEKLTGDYCERLVADTLRRRWWGNDPASVGVVFGPNVIDRNVAALDGIGASPPVSSVVLGERLRGGAA